MPVAGELAAIYRCGCWAYCKPGCACWRCIRTARISFSRNFETRVAGLPQSGTGAEITGLSAQIWEASSLQPTGIATQISKNWHEGSTDAYWAGFDGYWFG